MHALGWVTLSSGANEASHLQRILVDPLVLSEGMVESPDALPVGGSVCIHPSPGLGCVPQSNAVIWNSDGLFWYRFNITSGG